MNVASVSYESLPSTAGELLTRLEARAPELSRAAEQDDLSEALPEQAIAILRDAGCLQAVLPTSRGGVGLGWMPTSTDLLIDLLCTLGGVHLSAARLFEGHVNAFQLLWTYGTPAQREEVCDYVRSGEWLGVWNAPSPSGALVLSPAANGRMQLSGAKAYASGAGGIRRPLVTATHPQRGVLMVWPDAPYSVGGEEEWTMHGMRASYTRSVFFDCSVHDAQLFGTDNDYHRQPLFSGGAWRFLAAQLGAAYALVELLRQQLLARQRERDTHQQIRMARCVVDLETARKWVTDAAHGMDDPDRACGDVVQHANAARIVVERLLLDVMERVQRGIGLQSFSRHSPVERMARDLATYLRQPAIDALLGTVGEAAFARGSAAMHPGTTHERD
jgi:alkylation response protein AidB-like acyl-CoA dehydrogenase